MHLRLLCGPTRTVLRPVFCVSTSLAWSRLSLSDIKARYPPLVSCDGIFLIKSIFTNDIPLPTRYIYNGVQTLALIPRGALYRLAAVNMSFGNFREMVTRMDIGPSPPDVIFTFETSPYLRLQYNCPWVLDIKSKTTGCVMSLIYTCLICPSISMVSTSCSSRCSVMDPFVDLKSWDTWTLAVKATVDHIFSLSVSVSLHISTQSDWNLQ